MKNVKVENMHGNNGPVKNQFTIRTDEACYFQSYQTIIVRIPNDFGKTQLDKYSWDASKTTGKYRNRFLGETKAETLKKIKSGEYELVELN